MADGHRSRAGVPKYRVLVPGRVTVPRPWEARQLHRAALGACRGAGNASAGYGRSRAGAARSARTAGCNITKCCTKVSEHITITDNAIIPLKERVVDEFFDPIGKLVKIYSRRKRRDRNRPVESEVPVELVRALTPDQCLPSPSSLWKRPGTSRLGNLLA